MFKKLKTQFAIRKLSKGAAAILLSFGILASSASNIVLASTEESSGVSATKIGGTTSSIVSEQELTENSTEEIVTPSPETSNTESVDAEINSSEITATKDQSIEKTQEVNTSDAISSENNTNENITQNVKAEKNSTTETDLNTTAQNTGTDEKVDSSGSSSSENNSTEQENQNKLTITNDEDLKNFDPNFNASQLDQNHLLGIAGGFHILGENGILNAHTNGNFAAGNLSSTVDFGTRGDSHNHTNGDIYYIEDITQITSNGFNHENSYIVFGDNVDVKIKDNQVYANGVKLDKVKPEQVKQAHEYINIKQELEKLSEKSEEYKKQPTTEGVKIDTSDLNNQFIDVSGVSKETNTIYVNISADLLAKSQPIYITGLSPEKDGPAIIINVGEMQNGKYDIQTQIKLTYADNGNISSGEGHAYPNKLLWNFGTDAKELNVSSGHFMGSILATNAMITTNVNVDGTIVGQTVHIQGGESHRWDLQHPMEEVEIPETPNDPTDPEDTKDPEESNDPTDPEDTKDPEEPNDPTDPEDTKDPEEPNDSTDPEDTKDPEEPNDSTDPEDTKDPEESNDPTDPEDTKDPEKPNDLEESVVSSDEDFTTPLPEDVLESTVDGEKEETTSESLKEESTAPLPESVVETTTKVTTTSVKTSANTSEKKEANKIVSGSTKNTLPQTGEQKNVLLGAGVAIIALAVALLGLVYKKRKE